MPTAVEPSVLRCGLLAATAWRCGRFGDAPPSTKRAFYQPRTVRERGKCARSHNWWGRVLLWLAPQRLSSLGLLLSTRGPDCIQRLPFADTHIGQHRHRSGSVVHACGCACCLACTATTHWSYSRRSRRRWKTLGLKRFGCIPSGAPPPSKCPFVGPCACGRPIESAGGGCTLFGVYSELN